MAIEEKAKSQAAVRASIALNSEPDFPCAIVNTLATVVVCYGLFEKSPAVVIGAMIIVGWRRRRGLLDGVHTGLSAFRLSLDG
jgi:hypothetical protein